MIIGCMYILHINKQVYKPEVQAKLPELPNWTTHGYLLMFVCLFGIVSPESKHLAPSDIVDQTKE